MMRLRRLLPPLLVLGLTLAPTACRREPPARRFPLTGQVLAVAPDGREITIRHDEIKGFMPPMTMPFKVKDARLTRGRVAGDLVKASLVITDDEAWLETIEKTGWAAFAGSPARPAPGFRLLKRGDEVPDETLIDQDGQAFRLSSLRGHPVLLTFIYTRCPLPTYCPLMDRHFQAVQKAIEEGRLPDRVRLVSVSFDPEYDTPVVLDAHATRVGANRRIWRFATAPRARLDALGGAFGLSVVRDAQNPAALTHNLRTAVIDAQGRLVTILNGNGWTPDQAISALASGPAS